MAEEKKDSNLNEQKEEKEETPIVKEENDDIVVVKNKENKAKKYWWIWLIIAILVIVAIVLACVYGCQPNENPQEDDTALVVPGTSEDTSEGETSDGSTSETSEDNSTSESSTGGTSESGGDGNTTSETSEDNNTSETSEDDTSNNTSEGTGSGGGTTEDTSENTGGNSSSSGSSGNPNDDPGSENEGMSVNDVLSYISGLDTTTISSWSALNGLYETTYEGYEISYEINITYNDEGNIFGYDVLVATDNDTGDYYYILNYYNYDETYTLTGSYTYSTGENEYEYTYAPSVDLADSYGDYIEGDPTTTLSGQLQDINTSLTSNSESLVSANVEEGIGYDTFTITYYSETDGLTYTVEIVTETSDDETTIISYTIKMTEGNGNETTTTYKETTSADVIAEDWTSAHESSLSDAKQAYEQGILTSQIEEFLEDFIGVSSLTSGWDGLSYTVETDSYTYTIVVTENDDSLFGYIEITYDDGSTEYIYYGEDGTYTKETTSSGTSTYTYDEEIDGTYNEFTDKAESNYLIDYASDLVNTIGSGTIISVEYSTDLNTIIVTYIDGENIYVVTITKDSDDNLASFTLEETYYEDGNEFTTSVSINAMDSDSVTTPSWYTDDQENFSNAKEEYEENKEVERVENLLETISNFIGNITNISDSTDLADTWEGLSVVSYSSDGEKTTILLTDNGGTLYGYTLDESGSVLTSSTYYSEDGHYYTKEGDGLDYEYDYGEIVETYSDYVSSTYNSYIDTYINGLLTTLSSDATLIDAVVTGGNTLVVTYSIDDVIYKETIVIDDSNYLSSLTIEISTDKGDTYSPLISVSSTSSDDVIEPDWFDIDEWDDVIYGEKDTDNDELSGYLNNVLNLNSIYDWEAIYIDSVGGSGYDNYDYLTMDESGRLYGYQVAWQEQEDSYGVYFDYHETYYIDGTIYTRYTKVYEDGPTEIYRVTTSSNNTIDMWGVQLSAAYSEIKAVLDILDGTDKYGEIVSATIDHEKEYDTLTVTYNDKNGVEHVLVVLSDSDGNILSINQDTDSSSIEYLPITKDEIIFPDFFDVTDWTHTKGDTDISGVLSFLNEISTTDIESWEAYESYQQFTGGTYYQLLTEDEDGYIYGYDAHTNEYNETTSTTYYNKDEGVYEYRVGSGSEDEYQKYEASNYKGLYPDYLLKGEVESTLTGYINNLKSTLDSDDNLISAIIDKDNSSGDTSLVCSYINGSDNTIEFTLTTDANGYITYFQQIKYDTNGNVITNYYYKLVSQSEVELVGFDPTLWGEIEGSESSVITINSVSEAITYLANINIEYVKTWTALNQYQYFSIFGLSYDSIMTTDENGYAIGYQETKSDNGNSNNRGVYANSYFYLQYLDANGNPTNSDKSASDVANGPYSNISTMYSESLTSAYNVITADLDSATYNMANDGFTSGTIEYTADEIIYTIYCTSSTESFEFILKTDKSNNLIYYQETGYSSTDFTNISYVYRYSQGYQEDFDYADYGFDISTLTWM